MNLKGQLISNVKKKQGNYANAKSNRCSCIDIFEDIVKVFFAHVINLLNKYAANKVIIPKARFALKIKNFDFFLFGLKSSMYAAANQAADRLAIISDSTLRKTGSIFTINNLAVVQISVNQNFSDGAVG